MNEKMIEIVLETKIDHVLFPIDFLYTDIARKEKQKTIKKMEIYVEKYNQRFIKVKNSHRPISKILSLNLLKK